MHPHPSIIRHGYRGNGRLAGQAALITGGDSGIGRSVAVHYAREGASVAFVYLNEEEDAHETLEWLAQEGAACMGIEADLRHAGTCSDIVDAVTKRFGRLDILVNNAAEQHPKDDLADISDEQLKQTFETNLFANVYLTRAAEPHLRDGGTIINTASVAFYRGSAHLIDYAASKGAVVGLTRSLAKALAPRGIRVNGVAPGPIWTPLIPATFGPEKVERFGDNEPLGRAGQPAEVGPCYVFLASADASYMTGQMLHPNGGDYMST